MFDWGQVTGSTVPMVLDSSANDLSMSSVTSADTPHENIRDVNASTSKNTLTLSG